jgi:hypothetical protein
MRVDKPTSKKKLTNQRCVASPSNPEKDSNKATDYEVDGTVKCRKKL